MNDNQMATLAAWLRSEPLHRLTEYAESIGINIDANDGVRLFHFINLQKEQQSCGGYSECTLSPTSLTG